MSRQKEIKLQETIVPDCLGKCTQVKRVISNVKPHNYSSDGDGCSNISGSPTPLVIAAIEAQWNHDWKDEKPVCSDKCTCGASGNGVEVDSYEKTWPFVVKIGENCFATGKGATFTVKKFRREGECRA